MSIQYGGRKYAEAFHFVLDSTRQKCDVGIGAAFLSDNATSPVERVALSNSAADSDVEFLSNVISLIEFDTAEMRRMNRAYIN